VVVLVVVVDSTKQNKTNYNYVKSFPCVQKVT